MSNAANTHCPYTQNRELSWLKFNARVMDEAMDPHVPLLERPRFLSIFTSNLDEFFMVRVGSLTDLALVAPNARENKGGFSPAEQLRRIYAAVVPLVRQRDQVYRELIEALAEHGVADIPYKELKNGEREYVRAWYREAMRPLLMHRPQPPLSPPEEQDPVCRRPAAGGRQAAAGHRGGAGCGAAHPASAGPARRLRADGGHSGPPPAEDLQDLSDRGAGGGVRHPERRHQL